MYTLRFFSLQNAVCFIILTYLVPVLFTFYIQDVLKFKKIIPAPKGFNQTAATIIPTAIHAGGYNVSVITCVQFASRPVTRSSSPAFPEVVQPSIHDEASAFHTLNTTPAPATTATRSTVKDTLLRMPQGI